MSAPPFTDYPDWLRVDQKVGTRFLDNVGLVLAGPTLFGPFYTGTWEAVELFFGPITTQRSLQAILTWSTDAAQTAGIFIQNFYVGDESGNNPGVVGSEMFPVLGNFLTVKFVEVLGSYPTTMVVGCGPLGTVTNRQASVLGADVLQGRNSALAANSFWDFYPRYWSPGPAVMTIVGVAPFYVELFGDKTPFLGGQIYGGCQSLAGQPNLLSVAVALGRFTPRLRYGNQTGGNVDITVAITQEL